MALNDIIVTQNNSLEMWAVKLQFLLISENMLKNIASARVSAKRDTKTWRATTDYIVPDLIDIFRLFLKSAQKTD